MQPEFWRERWRTGQIGFHQSAVDRHLKEYWPALGLAPDSRVLVPLCGKSLDLMWLCEQRHSVTGVELSAAALESFCMENGIPATRRTLGTFDVYEAANLLLLCGDFFALTPELLGPVPAVKAVRFCSENLRAHSRNARSSEPDTRSLFTPLINWRTSPEMEPRM